LLLILPPTILAAGAASGFAVSHLVLAGLGVMFSIARLLQLASVALAPCATVLLAASWYIQGTRPGAGAPEPGWGSRARKSLMLAAVLPVAFVFLGMLSAGIASSLEGPPNPFQQFLLASAWNVLALFWLAAPAVSAHFAGLAAALALRARERPLAALCALMYSFALCVDGWALWVFTHLVI
jgi:hypothetical protein